MTVEYSLGHTIGPMLVTVKYGVKRVCSSHEVASGGKHLTNKLVPPIEGLYAYALPPLNGE